MAEATSPSKELAGGSHPAPPISLATGCPTGCRVKVFLVRDGAASLPEADMAGCVDEFVRMTPADVAKGAFDAL